MHGYKTFCTWAALPLLITLSAPAALAAAPCATGAAALSGWTHDAPGACRHLRVSDLPAAPQGTNPEKSVAKPATVVPRPANALPKVPDGFAVEVLSSNLKLPRTLRVAPNGDVFVSESGAGRVLVIPAGSKAPATPKVFTEGLDRPYGIAFYPPENPQFVYIAASNQVLRFPYKAGDTQASGTSEVVLGNIPNSRHWTRDLALSPDGKQLFVAVGSATNVAGGMPDKSPAEIRAHEAAHGIGATWGDELDRGVVRVIDTHTHAVRNYATGLRNCSGLAFQGQQLWCTVIERDHVGPDLVPDMFVRINDGDFHGWPWFYLNAQQDPAWLNKRPDLQGRVRAPDALISPHASPLAAAFYNAKAFPAEYQGDAFVTLHGSHSRPERTGYKVVRMRMANGQATGEMTDFMTGFMLDNDRVWGRPAGITVTHDGALLVSDDANGTIYRVTAR